MKSLFYKLIDKAYILPINVDYKDSLKEACDRYIENLNLEKFVNLSCCFIFGIEDRGLWTYIKQYISEKSIEMKQTKLLCRCLAQYIVVASFDNETITDSTKALYSLILMNMVVATRSKRISFPYPDSLQESIGFYLGYYAKQATIKNPSTTSLIPQILEAESFDDMDSVNITDCFDEVQFYSRHYARMQYDKSIKTLHVSVQDIQNPYEKAYLVAKKLSNQDWTRVDPNPVKSIMGFNFANTSKRKLSEIKPQVTQSQYYESEDDLCYSSLILNYIDESENCIDDEIKFSPLEFAIALYYEFVFENIKNHETHE